jgi:hypothetical protein
LDLIVDRKAESIEHWYASYSKGFVAERAPGTDRAKPERVEIYLGHIQQSGINKGSQQGVVKAQAYLEMVYPRDSLSSKVLVPSKSGCHNGRIPNHLRFGVSYYNVLLLSVFSGALL